MIKVLKNPIVTFILGLIIAGSIGVYATTLYPASQIAYKNTTVDHALDDLYSEASRETYNVSGNITPSESTQTFQTQNKVMSSNFVVNPIPSNYKNVNNASNFSASDLTSGKKAYNSNGDLITGSANTSLLNEFKLVLRGRSDNTAGQVMSALHINSTSLKGNYNYFKITQVKCDEGVDNYTLIGGIIAGGETTFSINQEYEVSPYSQIMFTIKLKASNIYKACNAYFTFYNK